MKMYFLRVCLVLLFIFMFSVLVSGEKVENVKIEILESGNNGVIYKVTNNDTVPIKWYKVRMTLEYEEDRIVSTTLSSDQNINDKAIYDTVKRTKNIYDYGPDKPIKPGESVEVFFKFPPMPTSKFDLNKNTVRITCNSEPEAIKEKTIWSNPITWVLILLAGLALAFM
ncbi:hypothetical protein KAU33_11755 [Candidatus Dependentiae bacterium]|nr:hypothetical protein [Candidatus Dependentiae bacterium]